MVEAKETKNIEEPANQEEKPKPKRVRPVPRRFTTEVKSERKWIWQ